MTRKNFIKFSKRISTNNTILLFAKVENPPFFANSKKEAFNKISLYGMVIFKSSTEAVFIRTPQE